MSAKYGTTKYFSNLQEKRVAEIFGGRVQIASGALDEKGDVKNAEFLFECKSTSKDYYTLSYKTWNKIREEAYKIGKCPVIYIDTNVNRFFFLRKSFVIFRRDDFDYYNIKSWLGIKLQFTKNFNSQIRLREIDSHSILISPLIFEKEELVALNAELFRNIVEEETNE